jgi:hypothetical protein
MRPLRTDNGRELLGRFLVNDAPCLIGLLIVTRPLIWSLSAVNLLVESNPHLSS